MDRKSKLMLIAVISLAVLAIGTTFAVWIFNSKQTNFNIIKSGCINMTFSNGNGTLTLNDTVPISDEDGLALTGYTFTLTNHCSTNMNYNLDLDIFTVAGNNLTTDDIKLVIDNKVPRKVKYYEDTSANDSQATSAKTLAAGTLAGGASETHNIKMWVDENSSAQNASFSNRLVVKAGPDLVVPKKASDECFMMDGNGTILFYMSAYCGGDVVVPNTIKNQTVTGISKAAFNDANMATYYNKDEGYLDVVILDEDNYDTLETFITDLVEIIFDDLEEFYLGSETLYSEDDIHIYTASEYTDWSTLEAEFASNNILPTNLSEELDGGYRGYVVHFLNIPLDLDAQVLYDDCNSLYAPYFEAQTDCWDCNFNNQLTFTDNSTGEDRDYLRETYLNSVDFSECTSLNSIDHHVFRGLENLTKAELPNNYYFDFIGTNAFYNTSITNFFIPSYTREIWNGTFSESKLTSIELYSINSLALYNNSFSNNEIESVTVNSTIDFSNSNTKPFVGNTSLDTNNDGIIDSDKFTKGVNCSNSITDFY